MLQQQEHVVCPPLGGVATNTIRTNLKETKTETKIETEITTKNRLATRHPSKTDLLWYRNKNERKEGREDRNTAKAHSRQPQQFAVRVCVCVLHIKPFFLPVDIQ